MDQKRRKTGQAPPEFKPVLPLGHRLEVAAFLEKSTETSMLLRIPVRIVFAADFPWGIADAFLGMDVAQQEHPIPIDIDDSRMGIPISDFLRRSCEQTKGPCLVWLDGYFEKNPDSPMVFFVRRYVSKNKEPEDHKNWIWKRK